MLIGTQIDLRDDQHTIDRLAKSKQRPVTTEQGEKLAKDVHAVKYMECSALTQVCLTDANGNDSICYLVVVNLFCCPHPVEI